MNTGTVKRFNAQKGYDFIQHEDGEGAPGTDPGAPVATRMGRKLIWTTVISAIIFAAGMLAYNAGLLNIERLSKLMGVPL